MGVGRFRKRLIVLVGALVIALAAGLLAVVFGFVNVVPDPSPSSMLGWAIPLVALFIVIGVTWLLLAGEADGPPESGPVYSACPSCGQSVLSEWRLCPYCGARQREWHSRHESPRGD